MMQLALGWRDMHWSTGAGRGRKGGMGKKGRGLDGKKERLVQASSCLLWIFLGMHIFLEMNMVLEG